MKTNFSHKGSKTRRKQEQALDEQATFLREFLRAFACAQRLRVTSRVQGVSSWQGWFRIVLVRKEKCIQKIARSFRIRGCPEASRRSVSASPPAHRRLCASGTGSP